MPVDALDPVGGARTFSVVSIDRDGAAAVDGHSHIVAMTTSDGGTERRWTLVQAISAIRDGGRFIVWDGPEATAVEPAVCPRCPLATLIVGSDRPEAGRTY